MEVLLLLLLLVIAGAVVILPVAIFVRLNRIGSEQNRLSERATAQLRAVHDALKDQRTQLDRVLAEFRGSGTRIPAEPSAPAPSSLDAAPGATPSRPDSVSVSGMVEPAKKTDTAKPVISPVPSVPPVPVPVPSEIPPVLPPQLSASESQAPDRIPSPRPPVRPADVTVSQLAERLSTRSDRTGRPATPPPPREPNRFETAAKEVLHKIWNWIIVGEDHIPKGVSVEFAVASQWLLRIGIVLLVVGVGFFLKYSIDNGLLSPLARVALSTAGGLVMLILGARLLGGTFHIMGQGLLGGGISTLYFSAFAATNFYHLISVPIAFAAMIGVTALSGFLAVRFHSILTAVLGIIGGYGTPVMLSTGVANFSGLYGYMTILGIGVLSVCAWKGWPLLNYLAFIGNFALVIGSLRDYQPTEHFWQVMPFLAVFFVIFSTMVFAHTLLKKARSNLLDVLVLFLNAGVFFCLSYWLIDRTFTEKWVAAVTLSLAAFYVAHVWYCLVRHVVDRELMLSFTALSAFFLAITIPLLLSREWITVCWSVQALVMLWIAGKLSSEFLRQVSYVLYALVLGRFLFLDLGSQFGRESLANLPIREYLAQLAERLMLFGIPIASMAGGYRLLVRPVRAAALTIEESADLKRGLQVPYAAKLAAFLLFGMLFLYMHLELNRTLGSLYPPLRLPVLTLLWLSVCFLLVREFAGSGSKLVLGGLFTFVFAVLIKLFMFDLPDWAATTRMLYDRPYSFVEALFRLLDFGAIITFFVFATRLLMRQTTEHRELARDAGRAMAVAGTGMLFLYLTLEVNSFLKHYQDSLRAGGVSILWSLFALAFLIRGIGRNEKLLRYAGLALFAIVTWKVFFVDLARLDELYRIVAFIILGLMVLGGSFLYLRARQSFATSTSDQDASKTPTGESQSRVTPDSTEENNEGTASPG